MHSKNNYCGKSWYWKVILYTQRNEASEKNTPNGMSVRNIECYMKLTKLYRFMQIKNLTDE